MDIRKLIIAAALPLVSLMASAQETPKAGEMTIAATVGYNSYVEAAALQGNAGSYETAALSTKWSDKKLMTGIEFGYFISDAMKVSLSGGFNFSHTPGRADVPGTSTGSIGDLPSYRAVADAQNITVGATAGFDIYFPVRGVLLFTGIRAGGSYVQDAMKYDEAASLGKSIAECFALRGAIVGGAEYCFTKNFYAGVSVEVLGYTYGMASYKPQEGIKPLQADSHNASFLAAPTLKIGFKF